MASFQEQKRWEKFLDSTFDAFSSTLNLGNEVIDHLRRERVISEWEQQTLVCIDEAKKIKRSHTLLNILRTDVASVRFRELVHVLQIRAYRCLSAANLFRDFAKNQYGITFGGYLVDGEDSENQNQGSSLFAKPLQMQTGISVEIVGSFNFDASLPPSYLPRPTEINRIRIKLNDVTCNGNSAKPKMVIISGIGGIGKSTLVRLLALDMLMHGEVDNVIWVPATTTDTISARLARLAATAFNIQSFSADKNSPLPLDLFLPQLYRKLFRSRTLIIFDNAEELGPEKLNLCIPSITPGQQYRPLILVTSRPCNWKLLNNNILDLGFLDDEIAADYVISRLGSYCLNRREAQSLVAFYGNLIIALEASTAAIIATNQERENGTHPQLYTVSNHLKEVEERQIKLQPLSTKRVGAATIELGPEYSVLESLWSTTFDTVRSEKQGSLALEVLDLCSCLNVDEIPVQLLELIWPPTETELLAATQLLKDYSLLSSFKTSGSNPSKRLRLHRVLQKIRWKCLESPEAIIKRIKQVLIAADRFPPAGNRSDADTVALYKCLNQVVSTLQVFVKSETVLKFLPDVLEELWYRSKPFLHLPVLQSCQALARDELLVLKYEYLEVLVESQKVSNSDALESKVLQISQNISGLLSASSAENYRKQVHVLMMKLELLRYQLLPFSPRSSVRVDFCRVSQHLLSEQPCSLVNYWAVYECGQALIKHYGSQAEFQKAYVIWNDLKKHGIGRRPDPVTTTSFNLVQKGIMWMCLFEGKINQALETLIDDEIPNRKLDCAQLKYAKMTLANLLACVGDYDASLQMFHQADQIDTLDINMGSVKPCFLTFARGIPEPTYFNQIPSNIMVMLPPDERQKRRQEYMDSKWLNLVHQILDTQTDKNVRMRLQTENAFSSALQCFFVTGTNQRRDLFVLYNKCRVHYRNGDLLTAKTSLEAGLSRASELYGVHAHETHAFRYKLGIVLRDQWISTGGSCLLEEALEIFISLLARFSTFIGSTRDANVGNPFNTFFHKCCHALGTVLFYTSDFNLAVQVFYAVWMHRSVIRGEDHTRTFESELWFGKTLNVLGRRPEAVAVLEKVVRHVGKESRRRIEIFKEAQELLSKLEV